MCTSAWQKRPAGGAFGAQDRGSGFWHLLQYEVAGGWSTTATSRPHRLESRLMVAGAYARRRHIQRLSERAGHPSSVGKVTDGTDITVRPYRRTVTSGVTATVINSLGTFCDVRMTLDFRAPEPSLSCFDRVPARVLR